MVVFVALTTTRVVAQDYNWAIGLRGGETTSGITAKYNFDATNSLEAMVGVLHGVNVVGLYERNVPVIGDGFNCYYGVGGNIGNWRRNKSNQFTMGVDLIVGLEYKLRNVPLAFSVDYKPVANFVGHTGIYALDFGLGMKVTF